MARDRAADLIAVQVIFLTLAWIFVPLRLYVRSRMTRQWGYDDNFIGVALIIFTAMFACSATSVHYGSGRPTELQDPKEIPLGLYYWWLTEILFAPTTLLIRAAIGVLLLRICVRPLHRFLTWGAIAGITVATTSYFFVTVFQCSPIDYFWRMHEPGVTGHCLPHPIMYRLSIAYSLGSFAADWTLGLLPIAFLWNMQLHIRVKISIACLLCLGLLAGIANLIRIPYLKYLSHTDDFLYDNVDVDIWTLVEAGLGLTAAGAATLRPLFRKFLDNTIRTESPPNVSWRKSGTGFNLPSRNPFVPVSQIRSDTEILTGKGNDIQAFDFEEGDATIRVFRTVDVMREEAVDLDVESAGSEEGRAVTMKNSWDRST